MQQLVVPIQWSWRLAIVLVLAGAGAAAAIAGFELTGLLTRGAVLGPAGDGERLAAVAVGLMLQPFGWSALRHGRLVLAEDRLLHLGLGVWCRPRAVDLGDVRRWGTAVASNRGRRERLLLFERRDHSTELVKLAMYAEHAAVLAWLTQRLGPPAAASATLSGVRFDGLE